METLIEAFKIQSEKYAGSDVFYFFHYMQDTRGMGFNILKFKRAEIADIENQWEFVEMKKELPVLRKRKK